MNGGALPGLPGGWVWTRLWEISEIILGQSPPSSTYNENGNGLPFYQGKLEFGSLYPTPQKWCTSPKKIAEKGDVLISVRAPVGPTNISPEKSCIGRGLAAIRPLGGIETLFTLYLMRAFENVLAGKGTGTTFNAITGNQLKELELPLPPLPEQRRIVTKLEELFTKLDTGVSALKKTKAQLKHYRQSVLKAACEGKLVPTEAGLAKIEGRAYEPAEALLARIFKERCAAMEKSGAKYKEPAAPDTGGLPVLPEGWAWVNVGQIVDSMKNGIYKPREFYADTGIACLRMYNIDQGKIVWKDIKRMNLIKEEVAEYRLEKGDLLVNRVNSRELVGKAAVIPSGLEECVFESKNIRVRMVENLVNSYYLSFRFSSAGGEYFNRNAQQVVGMASINQPQVSRFPIPLPPLAEQRRIVAEVERRLSVADEVARTVEQSLAQAQRLRQSILKKAFEGKLVAQDANDEPAGLLLEKIHLQKQSEIKKGRSKR